MSMKMKFPMKKVALGVSSALVVLGSQPASADAILFPLVINSPAVQTILSAVATQTIPDDPADFRFDQSLHYSYNYKAPQTDSTPWDGKCSELNFYNPSSVADIVTFNIGQVMNVDANGVLFETNPFAPPFDPGKRVFYPENFGQYPLNQGGYVTVDNNAPGGAPGQDGTLYGEALILEVAGGAAWGYRAYNPIGDSPNLTGFGYLNDYLGEVISNLNTSPTAAPTEAGAFEMYPGEQFSQHMLITPIPSNESTNGGIMNAEAKQPEVLARLGVGPSFQAGSFGTNVMYDRDENPVSGRNPVPVVCVGAPEISDFLQDAALTKYQQQGGWSTISGFAMPPNEEIGETTDDYTGEMIVQKLTFNLGTEIEGVDPGGTVNNALWLYNYDGAEASGGTSLFGYVWPASQNGTPTVSAAPAAAK